MGVISPGPQYEESLCISQVAKFVFKHIILEDLQVSLFTLVARKFGVNLQATFIYYITTV